MFLHRRTNKTQSSAEKRPKMSDLLNRDSEEDNPPGTASRFFSSKLHIDFLVFWASVDFKTSVFLDFCQSSYEAYDGEEGDLPKSKEADVKEERYSPWAVERDHSVRTGSPAGTDPRDMYSTEQLVPAPASYQPYR